MAGLCEGGNEPAGSLKAISQSAKALAWRSEVSLGLITWLVFFRGFPNPKENVNVERLDFFVEKKKDNRSKFSECGREVTDYWDVEKMAGDNI
ncbi:hypothetical protein ANN_23485 [Periplaneta americana]|uniref:Uncharacterized protein n=1 Tax=Periplaneta americana TaxID=6978 RepID=A0ABQ8SM55_PERAM|nr:hypothetical protein ANN_23485 [Periplaneta americana]